MSCSLAKDPPPHPSQSELILYEQSQQSINPGEETSTECGNMYSSFFTAQPSSDVLCGKKSALEAHNIHYNKSFLCKDFVAMVVDQTEKSDIVKLCIYISRFMFEITVLNVRASSRAASCSLPLIGRGSFGNIYLLIHECAQEVLAIKSIKYDSSLRLEQTWGHDKLSKTLKSALFEYCLYKLFSVLEVGPAIRDGFGFDLVIYDDAIEFCMQICDNLHMQKFDDLKSSLQLMHSLNIIHGDIKNANLMWSPSFHKNVFIDFGLSKLLHEQVGHMSLTSYFGTYLYCSLNMKELLNGDKMGYVDLYYNDVHCLKMTQQFHKPEAPLKNYTDSLIREEGPNQDYINHILNVQTCFKVYTKDEEGAKQMVSRHRDIINQKFALRVLRQFKLKQNQREGYRELLTHRKLVVPRQHPLNEYNHQQDDEIRNNEESEVLNRRMGRVVLFDKCRVFDIMIFFAIYYHEDVTLRALEKSTQLEKYLLHQKQLTIEYWNRLFEFSLNPYVSVPKLFNVLQSIFKKLRIENDQLPYYVIEPEAEIYSKVRTLAKHVHSTGINLFKLYQNYIDHYRLNKILILDPCMVMESYRQFPYEFFLVEFSKAQATYLRDSKKRDIYEVLQIYEDCLSKIVAKYNVKNVPYAIYLMKLALKIDMGGENADTYTTICELLKILQTFEPAQKTYPIVKFNKRLVDLTKLKNSNKYYRASTSRHNKQAHIFCFSLENNLSEMIHRSIGEALTGKAIAYTIGEQMTVFREQLEQVLSQVDTYFGEDYKTESYLGIVVNLISSFKNKLFAKMPQTFNIEFCRVLLQTLYRIFAAKSNHISATFVNDLCMLLLNLPVSKSPASLALASSLHSYYLQLPACQSDAQIEQTIHLLQLLHRHELVPLQQQNTHLKSVLDCRRKRILSGQCVLNETFLRLLCRYVFNSCTLGCVAGQEMSYLADVFMEITQPYFNLEYPKMVHTLAYCHGVQGGVEGFGDWLRVLAARLSRQEPGFSFMRLVCVRIATEKYGAVRRDLEGLVDVVLGMGVHGHEFYQQHWALLVVVEYLLKCHCKGVVEDITADRFRKIMQASFYLYHYANSTFQRNFDNAMIYWSNSLLNILPKSPLHCLKILRSFQYTKRDSACSLKVLKALKKSLEAVQSPPEGVLKAEEKLRALCSNKNQRVKIEYGCNLSPEMCIYYQFWANRGSPQAEIEVEGRVFLP